MRVLLVNRFFGGTQTPTGRMLSDVADRIAAAGHDVVALTSSGDYVAPRAASPTSEMRGVDIRLVGQSRRLPRIVNWAWFWLSAAVRIPFMRWDSCVLLTDPPFLVLAGLIAGRVRRSPRKIYWWTMDLYPEALEAAGIVGSRSLAYRVLRCGVDAGLAAVSGVIVLGPGQHRRLLAYRNAAEKACIIVPPWDYRPLDRPVENANPLLDRYGWRGRKVALYAGNLGEGHAFGEFLDGARWFRSEGRNDWLFVFVVRGTGVAALKAAAAGLPNVVTMDYLPEHETAPLLWSATVHLISMKPGWQGVIVPSKLYGVLKTMSPVLFVGPGDAETAGEIARLRRGRVLPSRSNGASVAAALEDLGRSTWQSAESVDATGAEKVAGFVARP